MELLLNKEHKKEHLYLEVYHYYRELITAQKLPAGSKMPSLRKCSQELKLSRTTIESAYLQLAADGYHHLQSSKRLLCNRHCFQTASPCF